MARQRSSTDSTSATAADGRSLRWVQHNEQRRAELVDATLAAIRKHGSGVGIDVIAREAGTRKPTIYRHFGDRVGLYAAVTERVAASIDRRLRSAMDDQGTVHDLISSVTDGYLALAESDSEVFRFVVSPPQIDSAVAGREVGDISGRAAAIIAQQLGRWTTSPAVTGWATAMVGAIQAAADVWLASPDRPDRAEMTAELTDLIWGGLGGLDRSRPQPRTPISHQQQGESKMTTSTPTDRRSQTADHSHTDTPTTSDTSAAASSAAPSAVTAEALQEAVGGRWRHVREELREGAELLPLPEELLDIRGHRDLVSEQLSKLLQFGHVQAGYRVDQGGTDDVGGCVTAFETYGHADLSLMVKAGVQWGLFGGAVSNLGLERHHDIMTAIMAEQPLLGCFAMTETGHGSDVQSIETTATYDPDTDEIVVHSPTPTSRKDFIGGAAESARMAAVFAQLVVAGEDHGVHCVLVPLRDETGEALPGITLSDCGAKGGLLGVDNGRIVFDQVRVPRTNLLGRFGDIDENGTYTSPIESRNRRFFTMLGTLVRGRVSVAGAAGAATRSALAIAGRYALKRRQFGDGGDGEMLLINYRAHQRKLMPAMARAYALMFMQNQLTEELDAVQSATVVDEDRQRSLETLAAAVKAYTTTNATQTIQMCREACGGAGYMWANRLTQLKADTDVFTTFEGDNTVLLQLVGKTLLTAFRQSFQGMDTRETVRWASGLVADTVVDATSLRGATQRARELWPGTHAITVRAEQLRLFTERETRMLETLGMRMRRAQRPDVDAFEVFNDGQDHLLATAQAHVERLVLEAFADGVDATPEGPARDLLGQLCDLYALSTIEEHRAWYLERGRMSGERAKHVVAEVNRLSQQTSAQLGVLIDGFGIPEAWLKAEMLSD